MLEDRKFDVTPTLDPIYGLTPGWPEAGEAIDDAALGGNQIYADLRRLPWGEAIRVYEFETLLIARLEAADDSEDEWHQVEDELCGEPDDHLYGLDLGAASSVIALSAARCIPFSSCNAGAFGGSHQELYPLVAFFARPEAVLLLQECATASGIGLQIGYRNSLIAYANDIRSLRQFAKELIDRRRSFRALRLPRTTRTASEIIGSSPTQLRLF